MLGIDVCIISFIIFSCHCRMHFLLADVDGCLSQGIFIRLERKFCEVRDVLQLINSLVYYHSNQSHRHKYISLHNLTIHIYDIEIISAELHADIFTMLWNKTVRNSRSRIVDLNEKTQVLLTAQKITKLLNFIAPKYDE